jgi:hypothetical protein
LPDTLRFHAHCWHGPTATQHPAIVARIQGSTSFAIHRTYLREDGAGKAALDPNKTMLGSVAGGAVHLPAGTGPLIVGEGIESMLSAYILQEAPSAAAWAALSTFGMAALHLPDIPAELIIAADSDVAGLRAVDTLANRAANHGWDVSIQLPPSPDDFNDMLPANKLNDEERERILATCNAPEFASLPPSQIVPRLADQGVYIASESNFYRALHERGQNHRRGRARQPARRKPQTSFAATGPCEVWSWDIIWLPGPILGSFFYLYLIVDIFSRKIVGWEIHDRETADFAAQVLKRAVRVEKCLTTHWPCTPTMAAQWKARR